MIRITLLLTVVLTMFIGQVSHAADSALSLTYGDTETLVFIFTDSNGDDFSIASNTFTFSIGTTPKAADILTKTGGDFSLSGNDAILELSTTDNTQTLGNYYWDAYFIDTNNKKFTFGSGPLYYVNNATGQLSSISTIIGTQNITLDVVVGYGTQDAFGSNFTAKGDIIAGTGAGAFDVLPADSNGKVLSLDSAESTGLNWIALAGGGNMTTDTYDPLANGIVDDSERVGTVTHNYTTLSDGQLITYDNASDSFINQTITDAGIVPSADFTSHTGDSTIHFTQAAISITAAQVSDFDTEVSNNASVSANTASRVTNGDSHNHSGGDGGQISHVALGSLDWNSAGHNGTAMRIAGFGAGGLADQVTVGSGLSYSGSSLTNTHTETDILPDQTGNSGKYLTTNGSASSWATVAGGGGFTSFDVSGNAGTTQEITDGNTLYIDGGTGILTTGAATDKITLSTVDSEILHDNTSGFVANEHIDHSGVTLTAGTGLTGGGDITIGRTFTVDVGITDDKIVQMDDADAADDDYAKITAAGIEGRSYSEVKTDLSLNNVENTAISTWAGSGNIATVGTVTSGTWQGTAIGDAYVSHSGVTNNPHQKIDPFIISCSAPTATFNVSTLETFRMPYAYTITEVRASLTTAPTTTGVTINITESGTTIFTTNLTIDATETTSKTAAIPVVLSDTALADDAEMKIITTAVDSGGTAAGLKVTLIGYPGN